MRCREVWIPDVFGYPAGLPQVFVAGRDGSLRDAEAVVEPPEPLPPLDVLVGGHRRHACADALPARRHLQRRDHAARAGALGAPVRRARLERVVADAVRLRRRRRRADARDARAGRAGWPTSTACRPSSWAARATSSTPSTPRSPAGAPVPVWRGELYFETHRGTLTSQLRTKLGNRRCERLLREAELWSATAAPAPTPRHELDDAVAGGADAAVPRHHPGLVDRVGPRRRRGRARPDRRRARGAHRRPGSPASPRRGPALANPATGGRDEVVVVDVDAGRRRTGAAPGRRPRGVPAAVPGLGDRRRRGARRRRRPGRRHRPLDGERPPRGGAGTSTATCARSSTSSGPASCCPPASSAPCSSWPPTTPCATTRGTSSRGSVTTRSGCSRPTSVDVVEPGPLVGIGAGAATFGPSAATLTYVLRAGSPAPRRPRRRSTGTTTSTCCRWRSRSTCGPTPRRAASSSAPCAGRRTHRRRGTRPSSRCARTATSTSPSRRSASPCSTTAATATPSSTAPCGSASSAAPATRTPTPTRAATT